MNYLIRRRLPRIAHLWTGEDTLCGLVGEGGLNPRLYEVVTNHDLDLYGLCAGLHEEAEAAYLESLAPLARPCPRREHPGG